MQASHSPRVLVVDDDAAVQVSLALLLKQAGFQPLRAGSALEALESLAREPVDLFCRT